MAITSDILTGPVAWEPKKPQSIQKAFALGCVGVLADNGIPSFVSDEINALPPDSYSDHKIRSKMELICPSADPASWRWSKQHSALKETLRWLAHETEWIVNNGLRPDFKKEKGARIEMTAWLWNGLSGLWHSDKQEPEDSISVHFHVAGKGMVYADSQTSISVSTKAMLGGSILDLGTVEDADIFLQNKGITIKEMKPGQVLFFKSRLLHRSSVTPLHELKFRAGIF